MDCPKCGYALSAFEKDCPRCRRIAAEAFARSPEAVWPPPVGGQTVTPPSFVPPLSSAPVPEEEDNSSGEERGGPPEIEDLRWNWGAFFCGWLWCFFHKNFGLGSLVVAAGVLLALFSVVILPSGYALPSELMALVLFGLTCYLGLHGHQFAWERRRFPGGLSQYRAVQRAWAVGGGVAFGITSLFCVTLVVLSAAAFRAYEARRQAAAHPAPVTVAAPTGPAPVVLRRPEPLRQPQPYFAPHFAPPGARGSNPTESWRRFTDQRYRRGTDPRFLPPNPGTMPQPGPAAPPALPPAVPASAPGPTPQPTGQAPGGGTQAGPPSAAPPAPGPVSNPGFPGTAPGSGGQ